MRREEKGLDIGQRIWTELRRSDLRPLRCDLPCNEPNLWCASLSRFDHGISSGRSSRMRNCDKTILEIAVHRARDRTRSKLHSGILSGKSTREIRDTRVPAPISCRANSGKRKPPNFRPLPPHGTHGTKTGSGTCPKWNICHLRD